MKTSLVLAAALVSLAACNNSPREQAAAVRATGENQAEDMRTHDPDTNLANGM